MPDIVVIGAGQAGAALVARLRAQGHVGALTLIGAEPALPYQRPPLSKAYLLGNMPEERLYLRNADFYAEHDITLRLGTAVTAVDAAARHVTLGSERISYDALALTTGASPRHLPAAIGGMLPGVHVLRSLADVDAVRAEFRTGARLLIVGGGYIGLEAAAVAARTGVATTLVEMAPRILQRVAAAETSAYFRALHQRHGVTVIEGTGLDRLLGTERVHGARLSDGREIAADFVIVGVGVVPDTALAEAAGLAIDNGIATDPAGRTSDPAIWAAGDCASFPFAPVCHGTDPQVADVQGGGRMRLESVGNAIDMAELVADNMLGAGRAYVPQPWFWSDQYDVKLQIAGLNTGYDRIVTRDAAMPADPAGSAPVSYWYYAGDRLLAVDAMNDSRAYMAGKRLIEAGRSPDPALVADPASDLRAMLRG